MRIQSAITNTQHRPSPTSDGNSTVMVVGLCVMFVMILLISFQVKTIGRDYLVRSKDIASMKVKRTHLLHDNRDLRKEKAFVKTDQGKEITARRRYLYKLPQEKHFIVTFETQK